MAERKRRHVEEYEAALRQRKEHMERRERWVQALEDPSYRAKYFIAQALAALELEPDEQGCPTPASRIPEPPRIDTLAYLDAYQAVLGDQEATNTWRADILTAATLRAAGMDIESIYEYAPRSRELLVDVLLLVRDTDLAGFWKRPGMGLSIEEAARQIVDGTLIINAPWIERTLRRKKRR